MGRIANLGKVFPFGGIDFDTIGRSLGGKGLLTVIFAEVIGARPVGSTLGFFDLSTAVEGFVVVDELKIEFRSRPSVAALAAFTAAVMAS